MATHDYVIANASGAAVRADLNNALAAIVSNNSNATEPATRYAYQWWADTNANILKFRNAANDAWIDIIQLDGEYTTIGLENGSAAAPSLFFKDSGTDTGLLSPVANSVAISTGGTRRLTVDSSGRLLVIATSSRTVGGGIAAKLQIEGTDSAANTTACSVAQNSNNSTGPRLMMAKSRGTSNGSSTVVQDADELGIIDFAGADGTDASTSAVRITAEVDGTPGSNDMPGRLVFSTTADGAASPSERMRLDSSGRLLVGASSSKLAGGNVVSDVQIEGTGSNSSIRITRNSNGANPPYLNFSKSRGTSVGANTVVQDDDGLGRIRFIGADGTDHGSVAAQIEAFVDGTPGSNDMPGRLLFSTTADGADTSTQRMAIDSRGQLKALSDGTPSTDHLLKTVASASASNKILSLRRSATAGDLDTGTECCVVRRNGDLDNTNNSYGSLSDVKLKENIVDANSQWEDLKQLQVRNYNFKVETGHQTHTQLGLIAQEVELVSPGLVKTTPDLDDKDVDLGTTTKSVNYSVLYMKAVKALQEAMTRIETLETKVSALEGGAS